MKKVILSLIVLAAMLSVLDAAPFQTMGMLRTPDAYILPNKAAEFQFVNYLRRTQDTDLEYIPYGMVSAGILDRIELGLYGGDDVFFANLKVKLLQETLKMPQISVGLENIFSPLDTDSRTLSPTDYFADHPDRVDYEQFSPYVVMSKQTVIGGLHTMFNLGIGMHRFVGQVSRSRVFSGSFASIEVSPVRDFSILAEYDGRDFNAGMKYSYKNFGFKLGYQALENLAKGSEGNGYEEDIRAAFAITYLFDRYASAKRRPDIYELAMADDIQPYDDSQYIDDYADGTTTGPGTSDVAVTPGTGPTTPGTGTGEVAVTPGTGQTTPGTGTGEVAVVPGTPDTGTTTVPRTPTAEMQELVTELQRLQAERARAESSLQELRDWINSLRRNP